MTTRDKVAHFEYFNRTFRGFLEGYALLVNNKAFGNPISIKESFELSGEVLLEEIKTLEERK